MVEAARPGQSGPQRPVEVRRHVYEQKARTPQEARQYFEQQYGQARIGELLRKNEDGTETPLQCYQLWMDPDEVTGRYGRYNALTDFPLAAMQAGYEIKQSLQFSREAIVRSLDGTEKEQTMLGFNFYLEQPARKPIAPEHTVDADSQQQGPPIVESA